MYVAYVDFTVLWGYISNKTDLMSDNKSWMGQIPLTPVQARQRTPCKRTNNTNCVCTLKLLSNASRYWQVWVSLTPMHCVCFWLQTDWSMDVFIGRFRFQVARYVVLSNRQCSWRHRNNLCPRHRIEGFQESCKAIPNISVRSISYCFKPRLMQPYISNNSVH